MSVRFALLVVMVGSSSLAAEKPAIVYQAPAANDDDRPVATSITVGPQGSDYALQIDFNKVPWGEACGTRCANATVFLDTDNNKGTGLKLAGKDAPETGADLAITVQGRREYAASSAVVTLKVKVKQYTEDATAVEQGNDLIEMDLNTDPERLHAVDKTVFLLVDANVGSLPSSPKLRVIYHPPGGKPLVGNARGLDASGANHVEIFKHGRLMNSAKKKTF